MTPIEWDWSHYPITPGWYAILYCWESEEGIFNGAGYWDGDKWMSKSYRPLPIIGFAGPFETEHLAETWAYKHDPEA